MRTRTGALLLALWSWPTAGYAENYRLGSFEEALSLGLSRNLGLQEAEKRIEEARQSLRRTRAVFLPKVEISAGFNQKEAAFTIPPLVLRDIPKDPGFFTGYKSEWTTRLELTQPLYTGGQNRSLYHIAERELAIQTEAHRRYRLGLEVEVTRGYYGVLLAQQILKIKQELIDQSIRHQSQVAQRLTAGDASRFEKLRADVQVANLQPELIRARNAADVALAELKNTLGLEQEDDLLITGTIEYDPQQIELGVGLSRAQRERPEIRIGELTEEVVKGAHRLSRAKFFPALGAFYIQDFRSNSLDTLYNDRHTNWTLGVTLRFTLFEGGNAYYRAREEWSRVEQAVLRTEQTRRAVQVEVIRAEAELRRAAEVIESQGQTVAQAEEALRIADVSYANGLITHLELLDTQLALDQARIQYVTAVYDYVVGLAVYRRAVAQHP